MSQMLAFCLVVGALFIGDFISIRTKAWIPSMFVTAVIFLVGYWTFFPEDIVEIAGFPTVTATLLMYLLITHLGTLLSVKELISQWKTVVICLVGILGVIALLFTVGILLFDFQTVVVAGPPLIGGVVSSLIMSEAASENGLVSLSVLAIIIYVMQGFAGYALSSFALKKEGNATLNKYRNGEEIISIGGNSNEEAEANDVPRLFAKMDQKYNTDFFKYIRIGIVALVAYFVSTAVAQYVSISPFVLCLMFGVLATTLGFLEKQPLNKANGFGFAILGLMLFIFDGLKDATPEMLLELVWPLFGTIAIGVLGMYIFSFIIGKILKVSTNMAFAVSLTALFGFPADYVITMEVIKSLTDDEKEREVLTKHMLPPMLVGGFVTVTIVSVVVAGLFVQLL